MTYCASDRTPAGRSPRVGPFRGHWLVVAGLLLAGCSNDRLSSADAQRLIESSARFQAPNVLTVRPQYCSAVDAPTEAIEAGMGRLQALEAAGAIRIARRAAAPDECTSLSTPMRERLTVMLGDAAATFHPRQLDGGGWEFPLGRRYVVSVAEVTLNRDDDPTLARALYRWAWKSELLGQLLQVSEEPVNAQATFTRRDGAWDIRDVGF